MAPRRSQTWPASMAEDPDVLSLDTDGRFVICRLCQEYQHVHGGHPPRPVRMTTRFGTRAWLLHKRRNMAHTRDRSWQIDLVRDADASEDEASAELTAAEANTAAPEPSSGSSVVVEWQATPLGSRADPRNRSRSGQISHDTLHSSSSFDINGITPNPPPSLTSSRQIFPVAAEASTRMEDISRNSDAVVQTLKPLDTQNLASNRYPGQLPTVAFNNGTDGGSALASYTGSEFQDPDDSAPEGTGRVGQLSDRGEGDTSEATVANQDLTNMIERQSGTRATSAFGDAEATRLLERLVTTMRELRHEQQHAFQRLMRLQERTSAVIQQLLEKAPGPAQ